MPTATPKNVEYVYDTGISGFSDATHRETGVMAASGEIEEFRYTAVG